MAIIDSDSPDIQKSMERIYDLVKNNGAKLHENLAMVSKSGELHVEIRGPGKENDLIIDIPDDLLISTKNLSWSLNGDALECDTSNDSLSSTQKSIAEEITTLYNLTDKIKWHKKSCPWLILRPYQDVIDHLFDNPDSFQHKGPYIEYLKGKSDTKEEDFICDSFIKTRGLGRKDPENKDYDQKIMPVVDYMNHNYHGSPFSFTVPKDGKANLRLFNRQPYLHSRECFAFYNRLDSLDCYFNYMFADADVPFVRSIPMTLDIEKVGQLQILGLSGMISAKKVPSQLKDLKHFMPQLTRPDDNKMQISHLLISNFPAPHAMRRVLRTVIGNLCDWSLSHREIIDLTYKYERVITEKNIEYYDRLLSLIDGYTDNADIENLGELKRACRLQRVKLDKYYFDDKYFTREFGQGILDTKAGAKEFAKA